MTDTGYRCDGCGTPTPFGSKSCGGAKCFNMAAETGQGWGANQPRRSPKIQRSRKPITQDAQCHFCGHGQSIHDHAAYRAGGGRKGTWACALYTCGCAYSGPFVARVEVIHAPR